MWQFVIGVLWATSFIMFPTHLNGFLWPKQGLWFLGSWALACSGGWTTVRVGSPTTPWSSVLAWYLLGWIGWKVWWPLMTQPQSTARIASIAISASVVMPVLIVVGSLLAAQALVDLTTRPSQWTSVASHLSMIGGLVGLYALLQWMGWDMIFSFTSGTPGVVSLRSPVTVFGNPGVTGMFLCACLPLASMFHGTRYRLSWLAMVLGLLTTQSTLAVVSAWCGMTVVLASRRAWTWLGGWMVLACIGLVWLWGAGHLSAALSDSLRLNMWAHGLSVWQTQRAWWVGLGPGSVAAATTNGFWAYGSLHSEPIQIVVEYGLIGMVIFGGCLYSLAKALLSAPMTTMGAGWLGAACAYGIQSLANFPWQTGATLMIGTLIWAALWAHIKLGGLYAEVA